MYRTEDPTGNWPAGAPVGNLGQPMSPQGYVVWRQGKVVCLDVEDVRDTDRLITVMMYAYRDRGGAVGGVVMEEPIGMTVGGTPADPKAVRDAYLAWLATHPDSYWKGTASRLQGGRPATVNIRWRSSFRILANIVLAVLLVRSLAWTVPAFDAMGRWLAGATMSPAERAALRRKKLLAAGKCPACEYDIRGLPQRVCPECAHRWTEGEARTIPRK